MRLLLALAATLAYTSATTFTVGGDRCTWGPHYWCTSFKESRECGATTHCIENVWSQKVLPEDNDDVCTVCKNMVKEARDTLRSNETQEELKEVFHGSCKLIPVTIIADECMKLTDEFIVELVESLSSEMDPNLVCATAGLCNSERIDAILSHYYLTHPRTALNTECSVCQTQSAKITDQLKQLPYDQLLDKMLEACGYMGSYSDACQMATLENFDMIRGSIAGMSEHDLCHISGLCSETIAENLVSVPASEDDLECEFCEKVIQHWVDTWTSNTTEEEFKTVLEQLCHKLDAPDRVEHCVHIVDDWYLPWFNYLLHEIDSNAICKFVGLCGNGQFMKVSDFSSITIMLDHEEPQRRFDEENEDELVHIPLTKLSPAMRLTGDDEDFQGNYIGAIEDGEDEVQATRLIGGYFVPQTAIELNKPGCVICQYVMTELQEAIGDHKTEEKIEAALDKICMKLPSSVEDQCENFVSTYAPALVKMLALELTPDEICERLSLCTSNLLAQQAALPPQLALIRRNSDNCALCEFAMSEVFSFLNDTNDQEMVKNVLDTICYHLPGKFGNECEKMVAEYANTIIDVIVSGADPESVCSAIQLCSSALSLISTNDQKCVLCEYAVTTLDKMVTDKQNEEQVKEALEKLCSYLPSSIKDECTTFVDTYSDMLIEMIAKEMTPDQICQALGLCPNSDGVYAVTVETDDASERPYCTLCEYAITEVDKMITDRKNEEEVKHALDAICYELSQPIQKECVAMVNKYTDLIIEMFVSEYSPEQVCQELHLCAKATEESQEMMTNELPSGFEEVSMEDSEEEEDTTGLVSEKPLCALCEFGMSVLEKKLVNNKTLDMVEHMVQMVCSYLPRSIAEPCEDFVDDYGDEIVHAIVDMELDPKQVCAQIQLCDVSKPRMEPVLVGGRRCSWGPTFWCASRFHATQCNTIDHCEQNVWNK